MDYIDKLPSLENGRRKELMIEISNISLELKRKVGLVRTLFVISLLSLAAYPLRDYLSFQNNIETKVLQIDTFEIINIILQTYVSIRSIYLIMIIRNLKSIGGHLYQEFTDIIDWGKKRTWLIDGSGKFVREIGRDFYRYSNALKNDYTLIVLFPLFLIASIFVSYFY